MSESKKKQRAAGIAAYKLAWKNMFDAAVESVMGYPEFAAAAQSTATRLSERSFRLFAHASSPVRHVVNRWGR